MAQPRAKIFLSSTKIDLELYRAAAKRAIGLADCDVIDMDQWPAEDSAPVDLCMKKVEECDALVVVVGKRYGWVPKGQGPLSITRLEVKRARETGKTVLAFLMEDGFAVRKEWDDLAVMREAAETFPPDYEVLVQSARQLGAFKTELGEKVTARFTTPDSLAFEMNAALNGWQKRSAEAAREAEQEKRQASADRYLAKLREETRWIDLRGLKVGTSHVHRAKIEDLYVTIRSAGPDRDPMPLERSLDQPRLVIQGDAGSGKTTFVRRMVQELCRTDEEPARIALPVKGFPIWIRASQLDEHIQTSASAPNRPLTGESKWIAHFLGAHTELDREKAQEILESDSAILFLDGLDEAPNETRRRALVKLVENAARDFPLCRIVVTTRPAAYRDGATLAEFALAHINELDGAGVDQFLELWSGFLFPEDRDGAVTHRNKLRQAVNGKPEIRRMARNPVMLTALAVVHWHEARLPEQRAELYESVLGWLAKAREERPGRMNAMQCLGAMGKLAWGMQSALGGRVTQIGKGEAARLLGCGHGEEALRALEAEELESGIIASRGTEVAFWHLTFQEYLAARDLAGLTDDAQYEEVLKDGRLYRPEWRETMLLFAGVLARQGPGKIHALFDRITGALGAGAAFADEARCVGLLSAMAADLRPVGFVPACAAYEAMLGQMKRLFVKGGAKGLDLKTRVEAAEALGVSAHPAIYLPHQAEYWVQLEGGLFWMGAQSEDREARNFDERARSNELLREVSVGPFEMGRNPVTVWEYSKFVEMGGPEPGSWEDQLWHPTRPVVWVSWHDAVAYCEWATCRLATEEEWEFAARGLEGRRWAWGDDTPDERRANVAWSIGAPSPVGMFPDGNSPAGLVDLSGNAWEWTSSYNDETGEARVVRGGSFYFDRGLARGASCNPSGPDTRNHGFGFRCARAKL